MPNNILITGGAGFIGQRLAARLKIQGNNVRILDNFSEQVHGSDQGLLSHLQQKYQLIVGDVRNQSDVLSAFRDIDYVIHLAAETGVGQSMYEVNRYSETNIGGTATLLDALINQPHKVRKIIVASSRAVYGEGKYACTKCGIVVPQGRSLEQLNQGHWEPLCPFCKLPVEAVPTDEETMLNPQSVYAITKRVQEELCLCIGTTINLPVVVMRFFNVYGEGQSLKNPYTGILSTFATRILLGQPPIVYEDGLESRDFVHVDDVVTAILLTLETEGLTNQIFNVGSGQHITILETAQLLANALESKLKPVVSSQFRLGDIRHALADISKIKKSLGYKPNITFEQGIERFANWARQQTELVDLSDRAATELKTRQLLGTAKTTEIAG